MTAASPHDAVQLSGATRLDFREFFVLHHVQLVRSLSLALADDHLGRDAAAEGFTRALARWGRVSVMANPPGWVYRVGLNWARSRRRKTRREVAESRLAEHAEPLTAPIEPDDRVRRALAQLSLDHRAVVVARFYLDWSEAQIADGLGIRPGTVKSRLSRALAQLGTVIADDTDAAVRTKGTHDVR